MTIEEIVNKAIPLSFPGVKCSATIMIETDKAKARRENLTAEILTLLKSKNDADSSNSI